MQKNLKITERFSTTPPPPPVHDPIAGTLLSCPLLPGICIDEHSKQIITYYTLNDRPQIGLGVYDICIAYWFLHLPLYMIIH